MLFCVGSFFKADGSADETWQTLLAGTTKAPIETYVLGPLSGAQATRFGKVPAGGDLCENVTYLGQSGVYTTASGIKVAYLSGAFDPGTHNQQRHPEIRHLYSRADVDTLVDETKKPGYAGCDVLLTAQWPSGITTHSPVPPENPAATHVVCPGSAAAAAALKPRYIFSGGPCFYSRPPYANGTKPGVVVPVTRFYGMAKAFNPAKSKWIFAFNLVPGSKLDAAALSAKPADTTRIPFQTERGGQQPSEQQGFFFQQGGRMGAARALNRGGGGGGGGKRKRMDGPGAMPLPPPPGVIMGMQPPRGAPPGGGRGQWVGKPPPPQRPRGPCWFCLAGEKVEKHLVVAVGTKIYLALSKGALHEDHVLVLPIDHEPGFVGLDSDAQKELTGFIDALRKYYESKGMSLIYWERNVASQHLAIEVVPVPAEAAEGAKDAFLKRGQRLSASFAFEELKGEADQPLADVIDDGVAYFLAGLADGTRLLHRAAAQGFPVQFGRQTVCKLLDCMEKVKWQDCTLPGMDEEKAAAKAFRTAFKPFAPK